jgi:3-hydroxyacyl-CoA dehydrogenase/enoyl-CoA hydratase/3-hydroxybutyryl-CoA epimerase
MTRSTNPTFEIDPDGIAWITFDDVGRSANILTEPVMFRLGEALDETRAAGREGRARVVVIRSGKPTSFIAGADIDQIGGVEDPDLAARQVKLGQSIFSDVASLPMPSVAAIHGFCVGGGVELSLSCDHRVLSDSPKTTLALPEVQLGILPAWGGTTRLPRLIGLQSALDLLLTGKKVNARKAKRIGLASEVVPSDLFMEKVRDFALRLAEQPTSVQPHKRKLLTRALDDTAPGRRIILAMARKKVIASTGGHYPAPLRILDVLGQHASGPIEASLEAEARAAAELLVSPVCKNLVHVFHMREAARKGDGISDGRGEGPGVDARTVTALGVLGAGVMGGGIGQLAAYRDIRVYLKDIHHEAVTGGLQHARSLFDKAVVRRKLTRREAAAHMDRISGGLDYHGLSNADVIVEAIVERMDVKKAVLRETEGYVRADCVLATNTSSLSVTDMASALERPERFCGMHFFNPVHRMPLVEVIRGASTDDETIATVYALALRLGKVPVVVGDGPGFLVNRILGPYLNEAGFILGDGASVQDIDRVARVFGMPMGPLRLIDEVGIDISGHAGASLHEGLGSRLTPAPTLVALAGTKRLGRKGGLGFYTYEKGREKDVDESIYAALASTLQERRPFTDREIRHRLVIAMINEGARILEDGIVTAARDVDLAMIMGTGFPPFRGGLLRFADTLHPRGLLDTARELHQAHGDRFAPSAVIEQLARDDRTFYEAFPGPAVRA